MLAAQRTIMGAVEDIADFTGGMVVNVRSVCHLLRHATISYKSDQARRDGDVCKPLARFTVGTISRPFTIGTRGEVCVRANKTAACFGATIVELWLESREKSDPGAYRMESRKWGIPWECVGQHAEIFVSRMGPNLVRKGTADSEVVCSQFLLCTSSQ